MSKFSEEVFNKIDNAKIDEVKEIRFKVECIGDVADILKEIIKYSGNDKQLRDYNDIVYVASEIVYDNENKRIYLDFEDEEDIK
jgi:hypothetical protein